jgi:hypothetical protein
VKLAAFATGIDVRRQLPDQLMVEHAPGEPAIELRRVEAHDAGPHTGAQHRFEQLVSRTMP